MENRYSLFTKISANRRVHKVIDDILTQRAEFSCNLNNPTETKELDSQKTWLLQQLENQHKKRTTQPIDLSSHPLLLILELSAYLSRGKTCALSEQDGLSNSFSLQGAEIGANLLRAYSTWMKATNEKQADLSEKIINEVDDLAKSHGLQEASKLTSPFIR